MAFDRLWPCVLHTDASPSLQASGTFPTQAAQHQLFESVDESRGQRMNTGERAQAVAPVTHTWRTALAATHRAPRRPRAHDVSPATGRARSRVGAVRRCPPPGCCRAWPAQCKSCPSGTPRMSSPKPWACCSCAGESSSRGWIGTSKSTDNGSCQTGCHAPTLFISASRACHVRLWTHHQVVAVPRFILFLSEPHEPKSCDELSD